jgi:hypothetical protein
MSFNCSSSSGSQLEQRSKSVRLREFGPPDQQLPEFFPGRPEAGSVGFPFPTFRALHLHKGKAPGQ